MVNSWTSSKTMSTTCDEEEDGQQLDLLEDNEHHL